MKPLQQAEKTNIPDSSYMQVYDKTPGCQTDAFCFKVDFSVSLEHFIHAFFDSPIFRLERLLIRILTRKQAGLIQVKKLASGTEKTFAVWQVAKRSNREILMKVGTGPIRSWLAAYPDQEGRTSLYFGSAVLPTKGGKNGSQQVGFLFQATAWFHEFYSRLLLQSAAKNLAKHLA
ncbi:hypothetical protein [Sneathiella sp.]|jgi:hypothetical protein|uniref:hypothetical protein n=1 Tax=Sneathiella sp. TaxID=1964365 RepID=UPI0039E4A890